LNGSHLLYTEGTTSVSGLTIGETAGLVNTGALTESGDDDVTLGGDTAGDTATLTNTAMGTWTFADNSGIVLGSPTASSIANRGLMEKTGGSGVSAIAPGILNTSALEAASGTLDLQGSISGVGTDTISGAATMEFDASVTAGQTVSFTGSGSVLELFDPQGFAGKLSGFDTVGSGDALELSDAWTYAGFKENSGLTQGTMTFTNGTTDASILFLGNYDSTLFQSVTNTSRTTVTYG